MFCLTENYLESVSFYDIILSILMNLISIFHDNGVKNYPYYTLDVLIKILAKVLHFFFHNLNFVEKYNFSKVFKI